MSKIIANSTQNQSQPGGKGAVPADSLDGGCQTHPVPILPARTGLLPEKAQKKTPKKQNALRKHKQTANVFTKQKTNKDKNLNEE